MKLHTGVFVFLFAHSVMRKLPEGLIIEAFLVLGRSPKLQPDKEPFKQGDETYKEDGTLTVPAAGIEVKAYL